MKNIFTISKVLVGLRRTASLSFGEGQEGEANQVMYKTSRHCWSFLQQGKIFKLLEKTPTTAFATVIFFFCLSHTYAGDHNSPAGARAAALGNAAVTYKDIWASFHNQAGLAFLKVPTVGISHERKFALSELSTNSAAFALPTKESGTFALSVSYFGYKLYNEQKIGLAYAKSFGDKVSAGIQFDYLGTSIAEGYGSKSAFTVEAGIQAMLLKNLWLGAHIYNPTKAKLADYPDPSGEKIPSLISLGLNYSFSDKVNIGLETEKDMDADATIKAGIEYHPVKQFFLRGGISTDPLLSSFGFGLELQNFVIDVAASYHQDLGFSPNISLAYSFK